jgi:uridine kinase
LHQLAFSIIKDGVTIIPPTNLRGVPSMKASKINFQQTPRPTVEIHLPDGSVMSGPRGTTVSEFLRALETKSKKDSPSQVMIAPIVGAVVNDHLRELTYPITLDARVRPVTMGEADGMRIYRRSLTFLLEATFQELMPDIKVAIDHSVSSGGYFCQVSGRQPLSDHELAQVEARMHSLVEADIPFLRREIPLDEAVAYFLSKGHVDKQRLLAHRRKSYLTVYQMGDYLDYHHGYMVPSTGYLRWFGLVKTADGFTLRFPRRHQPTELLPLPDYSKLLSTFRLYGDWLRRLGISNIGALNDAINADRIREIILVSEALHEREIANMAAEIKARIDHTHIILIAGPSSSGKTTFSKRLSVQLLAQGITPFPLEMDNFFLDREKTPRDEHGELDFESLGALDLDQLENDLSKLIAGESVQLPHFNFKTGKRELGDIVQLKPGYVIILEGIHGLNPGLFSDIDQQQIFRIYVSALTQLNLDRQNRISTTDTRLLRRIVRDTRERGYTAYETIQRWESVRRGEKRYIFPYQENADVMFNSALAYELAVLKPLVEPLLRQVPYGSPEHIEAKRLLAFLEWFIPLESDLIPDNSILREFIGNSILREFTLWHRN